MPIVDKPAHRLRTALREPEPVRPLYAFGAVNAMAARAAAAVGADALWVSSLEVSTAAGLPDANVLCVHDLDSVVTTLTQVTDLPVIVDIDNGSGSVEAVARYAGALTAAGAAAVCLEDSAYPKSNSFSSRSARRLADIELVCAQLAEFRARADDTLVLIGRTEALIAGEPLSTALGRAERFAGCGVDAVLVHSKDPTGEQALAVARAWDHSVPLVVVPTAFPTLSGPVLGHAGFRLCIYANQLSRAAARAMQRAAAALIRDGEAELDAELMPVAELVALAEARHADGTLIAAAYGKS